MRKGTTIAITTASGVIIVAIAGTIRRFGSGAQASLLKV
jgi:hypothetical protein